MISSVGLWWVAVLVAGLPGTWAAGSDAALRQVRAQHSSVELIVADEEPDRERGLWIGVRFRLDPGWHIYWKNPGDSGLPPSVNWQLPPGVRAAEFEWPAPERIPVDPLVNYGYSGEAVLPVRLTFSCEFPSGTMKIGASLRWLVCHETCIPDKASLQILLPLGEPDRRQLPEWRRQVMEARNKVPRPLPKSWKTGAVSRAEVFVISVRMDRPAPEKALFFPSDVGQVNDSAPQEVVAVGRDLKITLRKSDQLSSEPRALRGVLTFPTGESYAAEFPLRPDEGAR
ncbi:MAG: hypothetical protein HXY20_11315 [Acidobacteria bacterium]|nr:hypothetical protein [Acidobacteriota bacterium]